MLKVYLVLFRLNLCFSGLCFLLRMAGVLKVYLVILDETTGMRLRLYFTAAITD